MASAKVADILRSKGAPFSEQEIDQMPDHLAWRWIYADDKKKHEAKEQANLPEICFYGFHSIRKREVTRRRPRDWFINQRFSDKELNTSRGWFQSWAEQVTKGKGSGLRHYRPRRFLRIR
jgi:hypothetical protein